MSKQNSGIVAIKSISEVHRINHFSQEVIIADIKLLLVQVDRFYNRQFISRKAISNDTLTLVNNILIDFF